MKALSIRQPWAWLIVQGVKDIENRSWCSTYRGRFYVHAAVKLDDTERERQCMRSRLWDRNGVLLPEDKDFERGGIVGVACVVDVVEASNSPWFTGPYGLVLREAKPLPFRPCTGRLGFFDVE